MLEQKTMQGAISLIDKFGLVGGLAIYLILLTGAFIAWNIVQSRSFKRNAIDPVKENKEEIGKLRDRYGELKDQNSELRVELEKRVTHEYADNKLLPKIDQLGKDVVKLSNTLENQNKSFDRMASSIEKLANALAKHDMRINVLEMEGNGGK